MANRDRCEPARGWMAAYRKAIGRPMACVSVIVNSTEPSAPVELVWSEEELRAGLESFEAALVIWRNEKNYDPRGPRRDGSDTSDLRENRLPILLA